MRRIVMLRIATAICCCTWGCFLWVVYPITRMNNNVLWGAWWTALLVGYGCLVSVAIRDEVQNYYEQRARRRQ